MAWYKEDPNYCVCSICGGGFEKTFDITSCQVIRDII